MSGWKGAKFKMNNEQERRGDDPQPTTADMEAVERLLRGVELEHAPKRRWRLPVAESEGEESENVRLYIDIGPPDSVGRDGNGNGDGGSGAGAQLVYTIAAFVGLCWVAVQAWS